MILLVQATKLNKSNEVVDDSIYLVREDSNNLALKRGDRIIAHYGCVRTALARALNYAIKGSTEELTLSFISMQIAQMDAAIQSIKAEDVKETTAP